MSQYRVYVTPDALAEIKELPGNVRQRKDNWRIVYAITESEKAIDVVAIRKRPPYDYGDLTQLLEELE